MKYCPSCGTERVARFCSGCGFDFDAAPLELQASEPNNVRENGVLKSTFPVEPAGDQSLSTVNQNEGLEPPEVAPKLEVAEEAEIEPESLEVGEELEPEPKITLDPGAISGKVDKTNEEDNQAIVDVIANDGDSEPSISLTEASEAKNDVAPETDGKKSTKQSGWYLDPINPARFRFWDGAGWTDRVAQRAGEDPIEREDEPAAKTLSDLPSPVILEGLSYGKKYRAGSSCFNCGYTPEERTNFCEVCGVDLKPKEE